MSLLLLASLALGACRSETRVTGQRRPPTDPDSIVEYSLPPARFEEVARISVDAYTNEVPQALDRLHALAGRLGANAILLGPADVNVAWDGPRDSSEKPRVAAMTTFTAMAIWVPRGPGAAVGE